MIRKRRRPPRCGIQLCRVDNHIIVTAETDNLSVEGFFCTSDQPFAPGDRLKCQLTVPRGSPGLESPSFRSPSLGLERLVRVLRVELRGLAPGFGIACQFEDQAVTVE